MQLILTKTIQDALDTALIDQPGFSAACQREAETAVKASLNEDYGISLTLLRELATFLGKKHPGKTRLYIYISYQQSNNGFYRTGVVP